MTSYALIEVNRIKHSKYMCAKTFTLCVYMCVEVLVYVAKTIEAVGQLLKFVISKMKFSVNGLALELSKKKKD